MNSVFLLEPFGAIENELGLIAVESGLHETGLSLFRSAAARKHAPAMYNLALCYENGLGVPVNENTAAELYREAAAQMHPGALYNLAVYYGQGRGGLTRNIGRATWLMHLAATHGQQEAVSELGQLEFDNLSTLNMETIAYHEGDTRNFALLGSGTLAEYIKYMKD